MVFPCCLVEKAVINTYFPTGHAPCGNKLILSFFITVILHFLRTTCMGLTHELSKMKYIIPASRSFNTFFQTLFSIIGLSLLFGEYRFEVLFKVDYVYGWLIPLRSEICHPKA